MNDWNEEVGNKERKYICVKTDNSAKNNFFNNSLYILTNIKCLVMMPINSSFDVNCMVWRSYFHVFCDEVLFFGIIFL